MPPSSRPSSAGRRRGSRTGWRSRGSSSTTASIASATGSSLSVERVVARKWLALGIYGGVVLALALLFFRLPTGFLPTEDQGAALVQFRLPAGATMTRTKEVQLAVENYFLNGPEKKNVKTYFTVAGGGQGAAGQNTGQAFINLADYDKRKGKENSADAIVQRASDAFRGLRDAQVFALVPARSAASASRPALRWKCRTPAEWRTRISRPPATGSSPRPTPIPSSRRSASANCPTSPA